MAMITRSYEIKFLTPAFLGDAEQRGAWRTPPFKALLRHWWRVGYAARHRDLRETVLLTQLRKAEGELFGSAADNAGQASQLRMRLDKWKAGKLLSWPSNAGRANYGKTDPLLYLGYGPLNHNKDVGKTTFKSGTTAIDADDTATIQLAFPAERTSILDDAIYLMNRFGTLGSRSRNGWGSFVLTPTEEAIDLRNLAGFLLDCSTALAQQWPTCIGKGLNGAPLIWRLKTDEANWQAVMRRLAGIKIRLHASPYFKRAGSQQRGAAAPRHWLSYPVTKYEVDAWGKRIRLPSSLRFKIQPGSEGLLSGTIFHCPCLPPDLNAQPATLKEVWSNVHAFLDNEAELARVME